MKATDQLSAYMELWEVASVQPGYFSRTSVRPLQKGTHGLLQARDVSPPHSLHLDSIIWFKPERNPDLYRVLRGDILVTARGQEHRACLIDVDLQNVIASSVFYIIRPIRKLVLPGYLAWWLNQPGTQAAIESGSRGTGIGYIPRPLIEQLSVLVPTIEVQRRVSETIYLWQRQLAIQDSLDQKREQLIQAICRKAVGMKKEKSL